MTPIIEAIDRYGLVKRHLGKFITDADRFRKWMANQCFNSNVAEGTRIELASMATASLHFLSHDGVPWNNNLAENAVKLIASRRRCIDGLMSKEGIKDYLIFLSIFQTAASERGQLFAILVVREDGHLRVSGRIGRRRRQRTNNPGLGFHPGCAGR